MNGSTNVQMSALATFASAFVLGTLRYFAPEFIESFGAAFPELFTGALIVVLGLIFAPDAGIKALPGTGNGQ